MYSSRLFQANSVLPTMNTKDAFGEMILAFHKGQDVAEIVERDDGYIGVSESARHYFDAFRDWPARQRQAMPFVKGASLTSAVGQDAVPFTSRRKVSRW